MSSVGMITTKKMMTVNKCGIVRKDGVVRIGILCDSCAVDAMDILQREERGFWVRVYEGPESCEACLVQEYNESLIAKEESYS